MSIIQIETVFNIDLEFEIAPFHKRLLAYLIDFTLLIIYLFSMQYLLENVVNMDIYENTGYILFFITLPMLFYSFLTEFFMNGQTIGKKLMGIRVISLDGGKPRLGQYLVRWITRFFEWPFLFGYIVFSTHTITSYAIITAFLGIAVVICIAVTQKNQRLGDLAASTVLVKAKTDFTVNDTVFMNVNNDNYKVTFPEVMRLSDNDINTIKSVLTQAKKTNNFDISRRVEYKIKDVLQIRSDFYTNDFLEKLLEDYNYLATRE
jgi:uncharacterized RDD family membrane protein YckC